MRFSVFTSGYLRVERFSFHEETGETEYDLRLTNKEVRLMFRRMIDGWFRDYTPAYNLFVKALLRGDLEEMNAYMNKVAMTTFSYFDTGDAASAETESERFRKYGFAFEGKKV